jgi:hypothetical protein
MRDHFPEEERKVQLPSASRVQHTTEYALASARRTRGVFCNVSNYTDMCLSSAHHYGDPANLFIPLHSVLKKKLAT